MTFDSTTSQFAIGDLVQKTGGDYTYRGWVVGVIWKRSNALRYVVENDDGMLFIFNEKQLSRWDLPQSEGSES